jgi:hypothetical protein
MAFADADGAALHYLEARRRAWCTTTRRDELGFVSPCRERARGMKGPRPHGLWLLAGLFVLASTSYRAMADSPPSNCARMSEQLFGTAAVRLSGNGKPPLAAPTKLRHVSPALPQEWPRACRGTVVAHEALIAPTGKIEAVWTLKSPCPEFDKAIVAAMRHWEYTPTLVEHTAVPVCMVVTTLIHPR